MNTILINLNDSVDINRIYNQIRDLYPDFEVVKKQSLKKKVTWEEFEKYRGIVRSDINEELELEASRGERYESID